MAGILDSKTRIIDFVLTDAGKQQLRDGRLRTEFASYTDLHTFYEGTEGVADDASGRLLLEAFRRVQDRITPEALPNGRLLNFQQGDLRLFDSGILSGTAGQVFDPVVASAAFNRFLSGSADNFSQNRVLSERDEFGTGAGFSVSRPNVSLPNDVQTLESPVSIALASIPPLQFDKRFAGITNYAYRPPEGLLPSEDDSRTNRADLAEFLFPDPRPFGTRYESPTARQQLAETIRSAATDAYGSAAVEIRSEERDDVMVQGYLMVNGSELTKYVAVPLAAAPDRSTEYYLLGKVMPSTDGTERFVDALMLVLQR